MNDQPSQSISTGVARRQRPSGFPCLPGELLPGPGALWAVMLLGLALRLHDLLAQSLWLDEAMSLYWASLPAGEVLARLMALSGDPHPPLYYLILKAWIAALGDGEVAEMDADLAGKPEQLV